VPDPPGEISLQVGDELAVPLGGLGTAGYLWQHELTGSPDSVEVEWRHGEVPDAPGASADEVFVLRAVAPGRTSVRITQARPWERGKEPLREHVVNVTVE
jgi:predicted secreted protein